MRITVKVRSRSSRSELRVLDDGTAEAWLRSPPVDGRANAEAIALVAAHFGVAKRYVTLHSGASARTKVFDVTL